VNGSQGWIKRIMWYPNHNPRETLPAVVFVEFEKYSGIHNYPLRERKTLIVLTLGPPTPGWEGIVEENWVPIYPVKAEWKNKAEKTLSRTQLPLTLCLGYHNP
jgi:hypothetical protein